VEKTAPHYRVLCILRKGFVLFLHSMAKLRIAIVDDHPGMRRGLRSMVEDWPHGQVVLEAQDGVDYEERCAGQQAPDLVVVDLSMPRRDGWATLEWIAQHQPDTKAIAITFDPNPEAVHLALRAKACAVLNKTCEPEAFHLALEHVRLTDFHKNEYTERALLHAPDPGSPENLRRKAQAALSPALLKFALAYTDDDEPSIEEAGKRQGVKKGTAEQYRKDVVERTGSRSRLGFYKFLLRFYLKKPPQG